MRAEVTQVYPEPVIELTPDGPGEKQILSVSLGPAAEAEEEGAILE